MENSAYKIGATATKSYFSFKNIAFGTLLLILFFAIFFKAIDDSIQERSFAPLVQQIGIRFGLVLENYNTEVETLIQEPLPSDLSLWQTIKQVYLRWDGILASFFLIWYWFKFLMKIIEISPLSTLGDSFKTFLLAFIAFFVLQMMGSLAYHAVAGDLNGFSGDPPSVTSILSQPFKTIGNTYELILHGFSFITNTPIVEAIVPQNGTVLE